MSVRILPLAERRDLVPVLAAWHFEQWGRFYPESKEPDFAADLGRQGGDGIPMTLVALDDGGEPLGSASLIEEDIDGDPRTPWLASVYVTPAARGRGLAGILIGAIEEAAARLGTERLWLFTPDRQRLYAGLGWTAAETRAYRDQHITIMWKDLAG